jgi:hypothetical protein
MTPRAYPFQSGVSLAEYVRIMVHDRILQRGAASRERGAALGEFIEDTDVSFILVKGILVMNLMNPGKSRPTSKEYGQ